MKRFEVIAGANKRIWEIDESRIDTFLFKLDSLCIPYDVNEIIDHIDRRGKWYITFQNSDTVYLESECEMWKTLYLNDRAKRPVDCYGEIY